MGATTRHIPVWPKRDIPEYHFVNRDIPEHHFVIPVYQFCDFEIPEHQLLFVTFPCDVI